MTKDVGRPRHVSRLIWAEPKRCFENCWRAVERLPELAATYVEGFAVARSSATPIEHAWGGLRRPPTWKGSPGRTRRRGHRLHPTRPRPGLLRRHPGGRPGGAGRGQDPRPATLPADLLRRQPL